MLAAGQNMTCAKIVIQNYNDVLANFDKFKTLIGHEVKITYLNNKPCKGIFVGFGFLGFNLLLENGELIKDIKFYNSYQEHYSHMKIEYEL